MTKKALILLFALISICIAVYTMWTIQVSRNRSRDLRAAFIKADKSLHKASDSLQKNDQGTGAFKRDSFHLPEVELAIKVNTISRCIDSIKHDLVILTKQKETTSFSYPDKPRLLSLKNNLADYNSFLQDHFSANSDIKVGDLVNVADIPNGSSSTPWEVYYFENTSVFGVITELTFINTQILKLQHKATQPEK